MEDASPPAVPGSEAADEDEQWRGAKGLLSGLRLEPVASPPNAGNMMAKEEGNKWSGRMRMAPVAAVPPGCDCPRLHGGVEVSLSGVRPANVKINLLFLL